MQILLFLPSFISCGNGVRKVQSLGIFYPQQFVSTTPLCGSTITQPKKVIFNIFYNFFTFFNIFLHFLTFFNIFLLFLMILLLLLLLMLLLLVQYRTNNAQSIYSCSIDG